MFQEFKGFLVKVKAWECYGSSGRRPDKTIASLQGKIILTKQVFANRRLALR